MFFSTYPLHRVLAHLWRCGIINDFRKILHAETPPEAIRKAMIRSIFIMIRCLFINYLSKLGQ